MSGQLAGVKALLIDINGTLEFKESAIPRGPEAVETLRRAGLALRFVTNTDSIPPARVAERMRAMGYDIDPAEIISPVSAVLKYLEARPGAECLLLVSAALDCEFGKVKRNETSPTFVVVGDCRDRVSYDLLDRAFRCVLNGAEIVALNMGRYFYRADGIHLDTGGFVKLLEYASGVTARVIGKPSREFYELALADVGLPAGEVAIVGDELGTDIAGARAVGAKAVLVRTGKGADQDVAGASIQPDLVLDSVAGLPDSLGVG